jgi:hypothetical protein
VWSRLGLPAGAGPFNGRTGVIIRVFAAAASLDPPQSNTRLTEVRMADVPRGRTLVRAPSLSDGDLQGVECQRIHAPDGHAQAGSRGDQAMLPRPRQLGQIERGERVEQHNRLLSYP